VTSPPGQLIAPAQTVDFMNVDHYASSADGAHHIWAGDLNGPTTTDGIIVVDGNVVVQEGAPLPGGQFPGFNVGIPPAGDKISQMSPNGSHWAHRVPMNDGVGAAAQTDVVLRNGTIVAQTNTAISGSSPDLWDDTNFGATFFMNAVNNNGDMVIGGLINADASKDAVLVYYGAAGNSFLLASEGDAVDLDGNGLFDDNAFIDIFGNDDGVLTTDGHFYFVAALQDQNNVSIGNAFLTLTVPEPTSALLAPLAALALAARRRRK
jgi:MYXO-CTERM domain-containing protein